MNQVLPRLNPHTFDVDLVAHLVGPGPGGRAAVVSTTSPVLLTALWRSWHGDPM
ncbi:hypothetical protein [Micromonospora sp. NPDC023633]|uniref:hypothetical protein n=1 Tax=Micromonospora sp. NPDC023633 TaxID=3154320 RepID=UPI0033EC2A62